MAGIAQYANNFKVFFGDNVDFTGGFPPAAQVLLNGQLLIGSTVLPHIGVGTITSPDGSVTIGYSSPNITIQLPGGGIALETLSDDIGTLVTPSPTDNIQLVGHVVEQGSTKFSTILAGTNLLNINPMSSARWIVDKLGFNGTHTTIAAAITSAASGDTIFLMPGTYTENPTLKAGVNLTAYGSDDSLNATGNVIISGTCTLTTAGTVTISGIQLQTNSAALLVVSGSVASIVNVNNCYLNCSNTTGITFSSSSASSAITLNNCSGNIGTTGITLFSASGGGTLNINSCNFTNSGLSTTASTLSGGSLFCNYSLFANAITTSGTTAGFQGLWCSFATALINTAALTTNSTSAVAHIFFHCSISSGTASAISIGAGATTAVHSSLISSTNTNAITGAGTVNYSGITFGLSSTTINTTTQTITGTLQGSKNTAPSTGMLGEILSSSATAIVLTNASPANITSVNLTAGVWDVEGYVFMSNTGASTIFLAGINTTTGTLPAVAGVGVANISITIASGAITLACPKTRAVVSATTTYFLVAQSNFSTGANTSNGLITATRVG